MKLVIITFLLFSVSQSFAKKYSCNLQIIPKGKVVVAKESDKYIKQFEFLTPLKVSKEFKFKNIHLTLHKSLKDIIYVSFKDTIRGYEVSTEFSTAQETLRLNSNSDETFICWSDLAMKSSKLEKK